MRTESLDMLGLRWEHSPSRPCSDKPLKQPHPPSLVLRLAQMLGGTGGPSLQGARYAPCCLPSLGEGLYTQVSSLRLTESFR